MLPSRRCESKRTGKEDLAIATSSIIQDRTFLLEIYRCKRNLIEELFLTSWQWTILKVFVENI